MKNQKEKKKKHLKFDTSKAVNKILYRYIILHYYNIHLNNDHSK